MTTYLDHVNAHPVRHRRRRYYERQEREREPQFRRDHVGRGRHRRTLNLLREQLPRRLADHPDLIASARDAMDPQGFGMPRSLFPNLRSTQDIHRELETRAGGLTLADSSILFARLL